MKWNAILFMAYRLHRVILIEMPMRLFEFAFQSKNHLNMAENYFNWYSLDEWFFRSQHRVHIEFRKYLQFLPWSLLSPWVAGLNRRNITIDTTAIASTIEHLNMVSLLLAVINKTMQLILDGMFMRIYDDSHSQDFAQCLNWNIASA